MENNDIPSVRTMDVPVTCQNQSDVQLVLPKSSHLAIFIVVYCLFAFLFTTSLSRLPVFMLIMLVILAAIPVYVVSSYCMTISKTISSLSFNSAGWFARLFYAKRLRLNLWAGLAAVISALGIVVNVAASNPADILLLAVSLFMFTFFCKYLSFRFLKNQVAPWSCYARAIRWSVLPATLLFILFQFLLAYCTDWLAPNIYPTLQDAIANRNVVLTRSPLFNEMLDLASFLKAVREYYLAKLSFGVSGEFLFTFLATVMTTSLHFTIFAWFFIPATERGRCLIAQNIYSLDVPEPSNKSIFVQCLVGFIIALVVVWGFAMTEGSMGKKEIVTQFHNASEKFKQTVFRVDDVFYGADLKNAIETINASYGDKVTSLQQQMVTNNLAFCSGMRANVDAYLDWYYSLTAEYLRIGNIVIGNGEEYLTGKMTEYLAKGLDTSEFERVKAEISAIYAQWDAAIAGAKQQYRINLADVDKPKVIDMSPDIFNVIAHSRDETFSLSHRMSASAGVATVTATVAAKIMGKPAAKLAAAALAKFVAKKAGSVGLASATGAAAGAAIGSVIPFFGTAIGAAVGGVGAGIIAWVGTDAVVLKLEEMVGRENYKQEILETINEQCGRS